MTNLHQAPGGLKPNHPKAPEVSHTKEGTGELDQHLSRSFGRVVGGVNTALGMLWSALPFFGGKFFDAWPGPQRMPIVLGTFAFEERKPVHIQHQLGRPYRGWLLCGQTSPARIWEVAGDPAKELVLTADEPTQVRLFIF